jgi:hypothetical protein
MYFTLYVITWFDLTCVASFGCIPHTFMNIKVYISIILHFVSNSVADVTTSTSEHCPGLDQFYWVFWGSGLGDGSGYQTEITCPVSGNFSNNRA